MSTPLTAAGRITFTQVIDGLAHKMRFYVRNVQAGGTDYKINTRTTDSNDLNWQDAADALAVLLNPILATNATYSDAALETRSGTIWTPVSFHAVTDASAGGTYRPAQQATLVLRGKLLKQCHIVLLEACFGDPLHYAGYGSMTGAVQTFAKQFTSLWTITNAPWKWLVGRDNQYMADSSIIGLTTTFNRKVRRARGIT